MASADTESPPCQNIPNEPSSPIKKLQGCRWGKTIIVGSTLIAIVGVLKIALIVYATDMALVPMNLITPDLRRLSYMSLSLGVLMVIVGIWGYCTKAGSDKIVNGMFVAGILIAFIGLGLLLVMIALTDAQKLKESTKESLQKSIVSYVEYSDLTRKVDTIQEMLKCCGVHSYNDWSMNSYFNCTLHNNNSQSCNVPASCCKKDEDAKVNYECNHKVLDSSVVKGDISTRIYTGGCLINADEFLKNCLFEYWLITWCIFLVMGSCLVALAFPMAEENKGKEEDMQAPYYVVPEYNVAPLSKVWNVYVETRL